jgi:3-isopropylmalate/(R)-2-methylmalate dehydratase small subunit
LDDIGITLQYENQIAQYENELPSYYSVKS